MQRLSVPLEGGLALGSSSTWMDDSDVARDPLGAVENALWCVFTYAVRVHRWLAIRCGV